MVVLIDETNGAQPRLPRHGALTGCDHRVDRLDRSLVNTPAVLEPAARRRTFPTVAFCANSTAGFRGLDDGLVPIGRKQLLPPGLWS